MRAAAIVLALMLSGCATEVVRVEVPVAVPCLGPDPKEPGYQFGMGDYPGEKEASKLLLSDLNQAKHYARELKTQMAGCR